jgi:hypothetical protein
MPFVYIDKTGAQQQVELAAEEILNGGKAKGLSPSAYINQKFADADLSIGPAFKQMQASMGICLPGADNPFGLKATSMASLLDGSATFSADNTQQNTSPFGTSSRAFTMISIIDAVEAAVAKDRTTDIQTFYSMVGTELSINSEHFEQPVVDYGSLGGPEQAKSQRVAQGANPPRTAFFRTADRIRRIGSWTIGMEWSEQALKATTLDFVTSAICLLVMLIWWLVQSLLLRLLPWTRLLLVGWLLISRG